MDIQHSFLVLLGLLIPLVDSQTEAVFRNTTYGTLQGVSIVIPPVPPGLDRRLDVFVGVPYAHPPLGTLRWGATQFPDFWDGVRDATVFSPCCPQVMDNIRARSFGPDYNSTDEDCLYLNIYAPRDVPSSGEGKAVMFWIHGGSYRYGSGEEYDGRILAQQGDVVVVTINYRLGALGFLSTEDAVAPGNYGLMDIVFALRWVRDNIVEFGGDPNKVTLFGNSAGGAAVTTLMFSPEAQGLFQSVIAQSGNALSPWAVYRPPSTLRPHTEDLAQKLGCPTGDSEALVDCLRQRDALEIVYTSVPSQEQFNAAFAPRLDGVILTSLPEDLLEEGVFSMVPILSGTVPNEVAEEYYDVPEIGNGWPRAEKEQRMYDWSRRYHQYDDMIEATILHEYNLPGDVWSEQRDLFFEMRADDAYVAPHNRHAMGHAQYVQNTFMYTFQHRSATHNTPDWVGVPHGEEYYYTFGTPFWNTGSCPWGCKNIVWFPKIDWTPEDQQISQMAMEAWSNFAKTGNPSINGLDWPTFNSSTEHIMVIDGNAWSADQFYKYRKVRFWNNFRFQLLNATEPCDIQQSSSANTVENLMSIQSVIFLTISIKLIL